MFDGRASSAQNVLESWDIQPDDSDSESCKDGGEQEKVLRAFVEQRRVLEDGQMTVSDSHEVEELPRRVQLVRNGKRQDWENY